MTKQTTQIANAASNAPNEVEVSVYISAKEAAQITGLHLFSIYRRINNGTLPSKKLGGGRALRRDDVERLAEEAQARRERANKKQERPGKQVKGLK